MTFSPYAGVQGADLACQSAEDVFATRGFQNWKLIATTVFCQHELGAFHKEAVERVIALPETTMYAPVQR